MKRKAFLKEFLEALGAVKIIYSSENDKHISGTVIYDLSDNEDNQKFVWRIEEDHVPDEDVLRLVKLLNEEKLVDIDLITISREKLTQKYNGRYNCSKNLDEFVLILEKLEDIKVAMEDDGVETDFFFIHE